MSETLTYQDTIQRVGYTTINGEKVVQHNCMISSENPQEMRVTMVKLNPTLYKENRSICRSDFAEFEDAAYALQEELIVEATAATE